MKHIIQKIKKFVAKYVTINFATFEELGDWRVWTRCWEIQIPKCKNWSRFFLMTPVVIFGVNGWLFWGKRPK